MKKSLSCLPFLLFLFLILSCQKSTHSNAEKSFDLVTDEGIKSVTKNENGKSQIIFSKTEWSSIAGDLHLNNNSRQALSYKPAKVCITIASRKKECNGGIGFRCGIFDCSGDDLEPSVPGNLSRKRIQPVRIIDDNGQIVMEFQDQIDWEWLSQN